MSKRLEVSPDALDFSVEVGQSLVTRELVLRNASKDRLCAFKIRGTQPQAVLVSPRRGFLKPNEAQALSVQVDVSKLAEGAQLKLEVRHQLAAEGVQSLLSKQLAELVDSEHCSSTVVQCTIEERHNPQFVALLSAFSQENLDEQNATEEMQDEEQQNESGSGGDDNSSDETSQADSPVSLEPRILELLVKNVTRNTRLSEDDIFSLRTLRATVSITQWQEWLAFARDERDKRHVLLENAASTAAVAAPEMPATPEPSASASELERVQLKSALKDLTNRLPGVVKRVQFQLDDSAAETDGSNTPPEEHNTPDTPSTVAEMLQAWGEVVSRNEYLATTFDPAVHHEIHDRHNKDRVDQDTTHHQAGYHHHEDNNAVILAAEPPVPIEFPPKTSRKPPGAPVVLKRKQPLQKHVESHQLQRSALPERQPLPVDFLTTPVQPRRRARVPPAEPLRPLAALHKWCLVVAGKAPSAPSEASILRKRATGGSGDRSVAPSSEDTDVFLGSTLKLDHARSRVLVTRPLKFTIPGKAAELKPFQFDTLFTGYSAGKSLLERFRAQVHAAVMAASVATLVMLGTSASATALLEGQSGGDGILSCVVNDLLLFSDIYTSGTVQKEKMTVKLQALEIDTRGCRDLLGKHEIVSDSLYQCQRDSSGAGYISQAMSIRLNTLLEFERVMGVLLARRQQSSELGDDWLNGGDTWESTSPQQRHLLTILTAASESTQRTARIYVLQCASIFPLMQTIESDLSGHPWGDLTVIAAMLRSFPVRSSQEITTYSRIAALLDDALSSDAQVSVVGLLDTMELSRICLDLQASSSIYGKQAEPQYLVLRVLERMLNFCANFTTQHVA